MGRLEEAKKLLENAIRTKDIELISLANQLLESEETQTQTKENSFKEEEFLSPITTQKENHVSSVPVGDVKNRVNLFEDDGTEASDITTPNIKPTERRRTPFKKVEQTCSRCNKTQQTHPTHKREFFVCDKCLRK